MPPSKTLQTLKDRETIGVTIVSTFMMGDVNAFSTKANMHLGSTNNIQVKELKISQLPVYHK